MALAVRGAAEAAAGDDAASTAGEDAGVTKDWTQPGPFLMGTDFDAPSVVSRGGRLWNGRIKNERA